MMVVVVAVKVYAIEYANGLVFCDVCYVDRIRFIKSTHGIQVLYMHIRSILL